MTVGILPRDAIYHLQAVDCEGVVRSRFEVTPVPGQALRLGAPPQAAPLPPTNQL